MNSILECPTLQEIRQTIIDFLIFDTNGFHRNANILMSGLNDCEILTYHKNDRYAEVEA